MKKRRVEREREKEERDREQEMMQRDKEAEYFREWEKQEDSVCIETLSALLVASLVSVINLLFILHTEFSGTCVIFQLSK